MTEQALIFFYSTFFWKYHLFPPALEIVSKVNNQVARPYQGQARDTHLAIQKLPA